MEIEREFPLKNFQKFFGHTCRCCCCKECELGKERVYMRRICAKMNIMYRIYENERMGAKNDNNNKQASNE